MKRGNTKVLKTRDWFKDPELPCQVMRQGTATDYGEHRHEFFELFLITEGQLEHSLDGRSRRLTAGDLVFLSPARKHSFRRIKGQPANSLQVIFIPAFLGVDPAVLRKHTALAELIFMLPFYRQGSLVLHLTGRTRLKIQGLLEEMYTEHIGRPEGFGIALKAKLTDLLITASRAYQDKRPGKTKRPDRSGTAAAILDSLAYIEEHYTHDLTLAGVARHTAGVTPEYFSTVFHNLTGSTFTTYLTGLRLARARQLLTATTEKMISVCHESGFNDLSHFNRTFKKHTGLTPSAFRKAHCRS